MENTVPPSRPQERRKTFSSSIQNTPRPTVALNRMVFIYIYIYVKVLVYRSFKVNLRSTFDFASVFVISLTCVGWICDRGPTTGTCQLLRCNTTPHNHANCWTPFIYNHVILVYVWLLTCIWTTTHRTSTDERQQQGQVRTTLMSWIGGCLL